MSSLATRVNTDPDLAEVSITSPAPRNRIGAMPVLACPCIVTIQAGMGLVASTVGLFAAGYAAGRAVGGTHPVQQQ
ncbi:hypothetical protein ACK8GE_21030 [Micromonosporaceae bacterium DT194]|uniref:hypothetical protein n=1 Tax=Melissospora conviva TaxID=3388432 RepID=UPI003C16835B